MVDVPAIDVSVQIKAPSVVSLSPELLNSNDRFFLAWIDEPVPFSNEHMRHDEEVIWGTRALVENDFPTMELQIRKPSDELMAPGRKRWAWISYRANDNTIIKLFLGWLIGLPEDMVGDTITILLTSRPSDFAQQKKALADSLKKFPWWDPAFITPEARDDPDTALESRAAAWNMSHLYPLTMSVTSLIEGEDGHRNFTSGENVPFNSVERRFREAPLRRVKVTSEAFWNQTARGLVNLKIPLLNAAKAAGTDEEGVVTSFTGQGLADDFPRPGTRIGPGWTVNDSFATFVKQTIKRVSLDELPITWEWRGPIFGGGPGNPVLNYFRSLTTIPGDAIFYLWHMIPEFVAKYDIARKRSEIMTFTLEGDIQPISTEPGDEEELELTINAPDLNEKVDEGGLAPIRDARRNSYFKTARGKQSLEFIMACAASRIIARARCVDVHFTIPFEAGIDLTCRHTASLNDPRFPGGATGKVVESVLIIDPGRGNFSCEVTIACSAGEGNTVTPNAGEALYIDDDYIDESYYVRENESFIAVDSHLVYNDFSNDPIDDDGTNFFDMSHNHVVISCEFVNGEEVQRSVLNRHYGDINFAADALNEVPSEYRLVLRPLARSFETKFNLQVSGLMVNKTIDLRATG